jgi:hypothetical protein
MRKPAPGVAGDGSTRRSGAAGPPAARLLSLAAAPTFVIMALWSGLGNASAEAMCVSSGSAFALSGMTIMYALMSAFHLPPWLALFSTMRHDT